MRRRRSALAARAAALAVPVVAAAGTAWLAVFVLPIPTTPWHFVWWMGVIVAGSLAALACEPLSRRLGIMGILLDLEVEFPSDAPWRPLVVLHAPGIAVLQRRLATSSHVNLSDELMTARMATASALGALRVHRLRDARGIRITSTTVAAVCIALVALVVGPGGSTGPTSSLTVGPGLRTSVAPRDAASPPPPFDAASPPPPRAPVLGAPPPLAPAPDRGAPLSDAAAPDGAEPVAVPAPSAAPDGAEPIAVPAPSAAPSPGTPRQVNASIDASPPDVVEAAAPPPSPMSADPTTPPPPLEPTDPGGVVAAESPSPVGVTPSSLSSPSLATPDSRWGDLPAPETAGSDHDHGVAPRENGDTGGLAAEPGTAIASTDTPARSTDDGVRPEPEARHERDEDE